MSKEFKGTPGNWQSKFRPDLEVQGDLHIVYAGGDSPEKAYHVAYSAGWTDNETSKKEAEANARLICAAPDLLKALQFALPWLPTADGEAIHIAEQAINKALGITS
ncbi:hypothetical protein [Rouxiella sp. Mn2063]|uniref:hypothetical protein n=1 Tax=Rouxiella sp. Mn2063 TaxID=3395262 RepID=UPI003BDA05FE